MREFVKAVVLVVFLFAFVTAALTWFVPDRADANTWIARVVATFLALAALGMFLAMHFRRDVVPDYLHQSFGGILERDGVCFSILPRAENGICFFRAFFQNQFERSCMVRIVIRPARGWLGRARFDPVIFDFHCGPAAFGLVRLATPVPQEFQGKRLKFEIGATVEYPHRRGKRLRFRVGGVIRANADFRFRLHLGSTTYYYLVDYPSALPKIRRNMRNRKLEHFGNSEMRLWLVRRSCLSNEHTSSLKGITSCPPKPASKPSISNFPLPPSRSVFINRSSLSATSLIFRAMGR